ARKEESRTRFATRRYAARGNRSPAKVDHCQEHRALERAAQSGAAQSTCRNSRTKASPTSIRPADAEKEPRPRKGRFDRPRRPRKIGDRGRYQRTRFEIGGSGIESSNGDQRQRSRPEGAGTGRRPERTAGDARRESAGTDSPGRGGIEQTPGS